MTEYAQLLEEACPGTLLRALSDHEIAALKQVDAFCILFVNRSGSTLLSESLYLAGFPIPPHVEIFDPDLVANTLGDDCSKTFTDYYLSTILGWAEHDLVGFKAGVHQLQWLIDIGYLQCFRSMKIISVTREDKLEQAISLYVAQQTGRWQSNMQGAIDGIEVTYDFEAIYKVLEEILFLEYLNKRLCWRFNLPVLDLSYREIVHCNQDVISRVKDFLAPQCLANRTAERLSKIEKQRFVYHSDFLARLKNDLSIFKK